MSFLRKGLLPKWRLLRRPNKLGLLAMTEDALLRHCERSEAISNAEYQAWQQTRKQEASFLYTPCESAIQYFKFLFYVCDFEVRLP